MIGNLTAEEWFRENWEKFENKMAFNSFLLRNADSFSESFLREFQDCFELEDIIFYTNPSVDFVRELNPSCFVGENYWSEKQIEEFRDRIRWYDMFTHNWNIGDDFMNRWGNELHDLAGVLQERHINRINNDPAYRKRLEEEIQLMREIGLDVF